MFTGIVQKLCPVAAIEKLPHHVKLAVALDDQTHLQLGASIAIDGVCLTVVKKDGSTVWFDVIEETLSKTTLNDVAVGKMVNVERAARFGDEIGGHLVSGHVIGTAEIEKIEENRYTFRCHPDWMKYFLPKGYIAVDGISLTIVDVDSKGTFSVHLIPETLARTTLGIKSQGTRVNIEIDAQTQAIVDTVERLSHHFCIT
jgi:riboflavin synthase